MQEHGWRVGRLTEIAPGLDTGVVGLSDVAPPSLPLFVLRPVL
jgi:hypothetical protein